MRSRQTLLLGVILGLAVGPPAAARSDAAATLVAGTPSKWRPYKGDWLPIEPGDLGAVAAPAAGGGDGDAPAAHAIQLYREHVVNHMDGSETFYRRFKVLSDAGKRVADVEIHYGREWMEVSDFKARTIRPDGSIVPFTGKMLEKVALKTSDFRIATRVAALGEVEVGSIVEYRYRITHQFIVSYAGNWRVDEEFPTRHAHFALRPLPQSRLGFTLVGLPREAVPAEVNDGYFAVELRNLAARIEEPHALPEEAIGRRIRYFYGRRGADTPEKYWELWCQDQAVWLKPYLAPHARVSDAAAAALRGVEGSEARLRKLYDIAAGIRNLSYERWQTTEERKREKLADNKNAGDVLARGKGSSQDINLLLVALATSAGMDAALAHIAPRDRVLFTPNLVDPGVLTASLVRVRAEGHEWWLDPGTRFCPFGLLPWPKTFASGWVLGRDGSGELVATPKPRSSDNQERLRGTLRLTPAGELRGEIAMQLEGNSALASRLMATQRDEAGRRKSIEDMLRANLPEGAKVTLGAGDGPWDRGGAPLVLPFTIEVDDLVSAAGRRMLLPLGLFETRDPQPFPHVQRAGPVHYPYSRVQQSDITIELPPGFAVESLPPAASAELPPAVYAASVVSEPGRLVIARRLEYRNVLIDVPQYPMLREFFGKVGAADEAQIVLTAPEQP